MLFEIAIRRDHENSKSRLEFHRNVERAAASARSIMDDDDCALLAEVRCGGRPVWTIGRGWNSHTCRDTSACGQACPQKTNRKRGADAGRLTLTRQSEASAGAPLGGPPRDSERLTIGNRGC